jgi:hypothetical protein
MSHPQNPQNSPIPPQPQGDQQPQGAGQPQGSQPQFRIPQYAHPQDPQQWAPQQHTPSPGYPGGYPPQNQPYGQNPQFGQDQPYGQKPPKQKKPLLKRWWFWLIVIVVLIAIISSLGGGGDEASSESADSSSAEGQKAGADKSDDKSAGKSDDKAAAESEHGVGDTVAADDWEITVDKVDDGVSRVGDEYLGAEAQGQFVQISLSVKNTGSEADYFFEDDIKLADDAGNTYSADSEAGIYAAEDNILFLEEINPGNTAKGVLVFDVPEDVDPSRLTFAGGLFSDPVEISLK